MALTFNAIARAASFSPSQAFPLDARSYFESYNLAVAAALTAAEAGTKDASNTVYYIGQTLVVNEGGAATLYIIQPNKSLKEVGSVPVGDGKSIEVVDGNIKLKGFGSGYYKYNQNYKPAPAEGEDNRTEDEKSQYIFVEGEFKAGLQPQIVSAAEGSGFEIAWYEPNPTTVEGLQSEITALSGSVNALSGRVDDVNDRIDDIEDNYATTKWVEEQAYLQAKDVEDKVDSSELNNYYTKEEANAEFMTEAEVDARVNKVIADAVADDTIENLTQLVEYIAEHGGEAAEMATAIKNLEDNKANSADVYGKNEVYTKTEAEGMVDGKLTGYATQDWVGKQGFATSSALSDLSDVVDEKADASALSDYYTKEEIENKQYLVAANIADKADRSELDAYQLKITEANKLDYSLISNMPSFIESDAFNDFSDEVYEEIGKVEAKIPSTDDILAIVTSQGYATTDALSTAVSGLETLISGKASQADLDDLADVVDGKVTADEVNDLIAAATIDASKVSGSVASAQKVDQGLTFVIGQDNSIVFDGSAAKEVDLPAIVNSVVGESIQANADGISDLSDRVDDIEDTMILTVKDAEGKSFVSGQDVIIPVATAEALGLVKSASVENGVEVAADGKMSVHSLNVNKLVQTEGEELILDGGNSGYKPEN